MTTALPSRRLTARRRNLARPPVVAINLPANADRDLVRQSLARLRRDGIRAVVAIAPATVDAIR